MTPPTDLSSPPTDQGAQQRAAQAADEAAAQASQVAGTAKESAAKVAETAEQELHTMKAEAADAAKTVASDVRQQLRAQAEDQASKVSSTLGDLSGQLRSMAEAGSPGLAQDVVRDLSQRADALRSRLDQQGIDGVIGDARRFARNRPGLFLAGAAVAGLVVGRVIKSTDTHGIVETAKPHEGDGQTPLSSGTYGELPPTGATTTATFPAAGATPLTTPVAPGPAGGQRAERPLHATGDPTL